MASDDTLERQLPSARRTRRCRHCKSEAGDPPLLTVDSRNVYDWFLCEACWLLLEIGFSDARPYDDLYQYLTPLTDASPTLRCTTTSFGDECCWTDRGGLVK
jgi:hypothetical protein